MPKLHEVLAVEGDLSATATKIMEEAIITFTKKPDHFQESHRSLRMFDDARAEENMDEHKVMVTTVADKLEYVSDMVTRYLDAFARKEATNQTAKADLVVRGQTLIADVPATLLLGLETKLKALRRVYEAIPTLQPGIDWEKDSERGQNVWKAFEPETRMRTEKVIQHKTLYEATKEHPAQIEKWTQDMPVGRFTINHWSGMLSSAEKSDLLFRIDDLIQAAKKARQRANTAEVTDLSIGNAIFDYIHN